MKLETDVGRLNKRITIQQLSAADEFDTIGNQLPGWTDYHSCWAAITGGKGSESQQAREPKQKVEKNFKHHKFHKGDKCGHKCDKADKCGKCPKHFKKAFCNDACTFCQSKNAHNRCLHKLCKFFLCKTRKAFSCFKS